MNEYQPLYTTRNDPKTYLYAMLRIRDRTAFTSGLDIKYEYHGIQISNRDRSRLFKTEVKRSKKEWLELLSSPVVGDTDDGDLTGY